MGCCPAVCWFNGLLPRVHVGSVGYCPGYMLAQWAIAQVTCQNPRTCIAMCCYYIHAFNSFWYGGVSAQRWDCLYVIYSAFVRLSMFSGSGPLCGVNYPHSVVVVLYFEETICTDHHGSVGIMLWHCLPQQQSLWEKNAEKEIEELLSAEQGEGLHRPAIKLKFWASASRRYKNRWNSLGNNDLEFWLHQKGAHEATKLKTMATSGYLLPCTPDICRWRQNIYRFARSAMMSILNMNSDSWPQTTLWFNALIFSNHVRLAATNALLNSLEFTKANFDQEVHLTFVKADVSIYKYA